MSKACCPLCGADLELPDGLPRHIVCCPACGGDFKSDEAVPPEEEQLPAPPRAAPPRIDTRAITQPIPPPPSYAEPPPTSFSPDPLGAYRGDTLAMTRPGPSPGTAPVPGAAPSAEGEGERFGAFDLLEKLGASDVAVTYRARRRAQGGLVALKVLAPGKTATSEEIAALVERARAASKLKHDGIARVIEVRRRDDTDYIASEFIQGRSLADMMDVGEPQGGDAVELARELAWILDRAHGSGVVHGDLRPSNVIVDEKGAPHLTDFGLARELWRLSPGDLRSIGGAGPAFPLYVAPEQLRGEPPTARSDIYSLGALLYRMIARRPPFEGRDVLELVLAIDRGRPVPPASVNIRVPPTVNAIVLKCLEREPAHRYETAEELASEIERFLHGKKVQTRMPGAATRLVRALALRWKGVAAVLVLAAAAAAGAWFAGRVTALPEWLAAVGGTEFRAEAALHAADDLARLGRLDEAESKLVPLESREDLPAWLRSGAAARLGVIEFRRGRYERAAARFSRAIGIRPGGDAGNHYLYGVALWHAGGDPAKVAAELGEALRLDPVRAASPACQYSYARACELAGEAAEARRAFERVIVLDPAFKPDQVSAHLAKLKKR
ncbi:MAG: protein kinase domain-containing protein [Planctomycetota bacterium]